MNLTEQIKTVLSYKSTVNDWKNNHLSIEWLAANEVSKIVMKEPLRKSRNCGCVDDLFIMLHSMTKENINIKQNSMNSEFKLEKDGMLMMHGVDILTNNNLTDEKALKLLSTHPKAIKRFATKPSDWKKKVAAYVAKAEAAAKKKADKEVFDEGDEVKENNPPSAAAPVVDEAKAPDSTPTREEELSAMDLDSLKALAVKTAADKGAKKPHHALGAEKLVAFITELEK